MTVFLICQLEEVCGGTKSDSSGGLERKNLCWTKFVLRSMKYDIAKILDFFESSQ